MAKKRANGEGNIRKRKDGRWEGRYTAGYDEKTGKRLIKNVLGKTQAEVKEKLAKAVAEAETVDVRRADGYTLGTCLQTWYELYAKPHLRFSTAEYYRRGRREPKWQKEYYLKKPSIPFVNIWSWRKKARPPWRNISGMSVLFICLHANRL